MQFISGFLIFFLAMTSWLSAEEPPSESSEKIILLPVGAVHQGDYFAMGDSVEISGTVNGDVYLLAEQIIIDGTVNGDVLACGGSIDISGKVSHNCRLLGGQILMSGVVGNNVTAIGGNVQLLSSGNIREGIVAIAGNADLASIIGGGATVIASNLRLSSQVAQNVNAYAGQLRLTSRAEIGGNLDYRSHELARIEPGAQIKGTVIYHPTFVGEWIKGSWLHGFFVGSKILGVLMNFLYTFVIGMILLRLFPKNIDAALDVLKHHTLKAFSFGLLLLVLLPLVSLLFLMTILGVPFALTLIALNIIGLYTAKIYSIIWGGNWLFVRVGFKKSRWPLLMCSLVVYFLLISIPIFGIIVSFVAMVFGLGAAVLSQEKKSIFNVQKKPDPH